MDIKKYTKNGKTFYKFTLYLGIVNGKRKYVKRANFKTKADARAAILSLQEEINNERTNMTFKQATEKWLKEYEHTVAESTYIKTERNLKNHILPAIGDRNLNSLSSLALEEYVKDWCKKLKYGRKLLGIVNSVYRFAIKQGYTTTNPALVVDAPKLRKNQLTDEKDFFEKEELQQFMLLVDKTENIKKIALFRVLAFTGIRKGELRALTWKDYYSKTLNINKAVTRGYAGEEIGPTKTKSSNRLISLDDKTDAILSQLKEKYPDSTLIFESETGGILSPTDPRRWFLDIIKGTELPAIPIHGFRHTHASLLFEAGMTLKQVQYRLGHSDLKTTMNIYTHVTTKAVDEIAEKFSEYIDF